MNTTLKTVLLTVLTLSAFTIAMIEISGFSTYAFLNKYKGTDVNAADKKSLDEKRDNEMKTLPKTTFDFPETKHDFGTIKEGDKVKWSWKFKNTGKNPLMISNVNVSCGCTAPFFPKEAIAPGAESEITLEFNSAGKEGHVMKNALVNANTENAPFSIGFTADVIKK